MIRILNESIINKIAAGEVIERPASVVKELLENSFDAGADEIKIEIYDYGLKKIKISDNGLGMTKDDALLSFKRHATSKIKKESDLFEIRSLGFRGEALASIAEISNLRIITKTQNKSLGTYIEIEAGKLIKSEEIGCPAGTIIEVNNLFFNVPVRKKYLKTNDIELSNILKVITKYALIKKRVSIRVFHNNKELLNSQKTDSLLNNIIYVYGAEIGKNLIKVDYEEDNISIKGYISKPSLTRADKSEQSLYINERAIKNAVISEAIYNAYKTLLFINRHPIYVLNININPNDIDVNVHPTKTVVRLKHEGLLSKVVTNAIKEALYSSNLIVEASLENSKDRKPIKKYSLPEEKQTVLTIREKSTKYSIQKEEKEKRVFGPFYVLGQINRTFIIVENPEGLAIIDQHAAQERVNYEKFMKELKEQAIKKQNFLKPRIIELTNMQYLAAKNNKDFINHLGFEFEDFGNNTIKLISVPEVFGKLKSTLFIDILNELVNLKDRTINEEIEQKIIRFACRASVKAGDELTIPQMKELLKELEKTENPYSCPHGRPTIINFNIAELEKKFKRSGWN